MSVTGRYADCQYDRNKEYVRIKFHPFSKEEEINIHSETWKNFNDKHYFMIRQAWGIATYNKVHKSH